MWRAGVERWPYKFNLLYEYFNPHPQFLTCIRAISPSSSLERAEQTKLN